MIKRTLPLMACVALALQGCGGKDDGNSSGEQPSAAKDAAGGKTIAAGLDQNGAFFKTLKSVGLDATLAGPGPYTVLIPADQALAGLPQGEAAQPQDRSRVTGILTNHILPGTVLAEDIGKAIDAGKGKAQLATMGGGTITATREGGNIVLTDANGGKATVTGTDEKFSNGVVHRLSGVLQPAQGEQRAGTAAAGQEPPR
jgi:uncharacterized surface protein with fasciclin (FAS1) repeats